MLPAAAQQTGSVEGRVTSSTAANGVAGVTVTSGSHRATTDGSGTYRLTGLPLGDAALSFEAAGFFKLETRANIESVAAPAHLDVELVPHSFISGRVLDDEDHPMPRVRVEITEGVRGTGTTWTLWGDVTDSEGRYRVGPLRPGAYLVMARPNPRVVGSFSGREPREKPPEPPKPHDGERRTWVRTYYPSAPDRDGAARMIVRAGSEVSGCDIRLIAAPVYAIRGTVLDDAGKPANAAVSLAPTEILEMPETRVTAHDGVFEFPDATPGDWRVVAELERDGVKLRGVAAALVSRQAVENVSVRLAAPFTMRGSVEPRGKSALPRLELHPADGPPSGAAYSKDAPYDQFVFPAVYPGRYRVNVYADIAKDYYLGSVLLGEEDVLGKEVMLAEGAPQFRVIFKPNSTGLRGTVENCGGGSVLVLPEEEGLWNFRFIRKMSCDRSGHFEFGGIRPGGYYVLALDRIELTGLDDLGTLRRLASMGTRVRIEPERAAYVELKVSHWPD